MSQSISDNDLPSESLTMSQGELQSLLESEGDRYVLSLYVADSNPKSLRALQHIKKICEEHLAGRYDLEVIDIYQQPEKLEEDQVFAIPTLIKRFPYPLQRLIGDMTDTEKVMIYLDL